MSGDLLRALFRQALVPALALSAVLMVSGCSLVLDFSDKEDAGPPDDAMNSDGGLTGCDVNEPNDSLGGATVIDPGTFNAAICPAMDVDFYRFSIIDNQDMFIEIMFANLSGGGDLEMRLYETTTGMVIASSTGFDNDERIDRNDAQGDQLPPGDYIAEIFGFTDAVQNDYTFTLSVTAGPMVDADPTDAGIDAT